MSRWFSQRSATSRIVHDFNRTLLLIVDPGSLQAGIAARMREILQTESVFIFQKGSSEEVFQATYATGIEEGEFDREKLAISRRGHLARWLRVNETCLVVDEAPGVLDYLDPFERELLGRYAIKICVPLISLNRLIGFVLLGSAKSISKIDSRKAELLLLLAGQAALALENAALYLEQKERLQRLYRAERLATAGQLAAGVAHEIRNPLTAIRSTIQHFQQSLSEKNSEYELLGGLLDEVDRIDRTVNDLLVLTRARKFELRETDLREVLEQSLLLVSAQAKRCHVEIEKNLSEEELWTLADQDQIKEVFINLLINAIQAMPEGGELKVSARTRDRNGRPASRGWVEVGILDTGPGISTENLNSVFDPFFTTKSSGTGLGLAICHSIVREHEGEIEVRNAPIRGACALVRLAPLGREKKAGRSQ